ncbi:hypothetical protein F7R91_06735 [Streptomyces luteolifulvus]|uniref:Lipoprotein n=1 Tax=Streptomyces luteolifulvus TaxID=2615112 RepID=A0A6H9V9T3_9ACTN|nr:hypothetical protein [Streptomyces luteolifulvus]KAB1149436.1 hypothetical protein F7R91_06735 [Streptomyces luteolifulvus]
MTPSPTRTVLVSVLSLTALLAAASGCSLGAFAERPTADSPTGGPSDPAASPAGAPKLTEAQAQAALITPADLGDPWVPTQGAATWRDGLLKAASDNPGCQGLLDAVYTEELFGAGARTRAATGLDDGLDGAQLRYQILTAGPAVDRTLAWLKTLPEKCGQFTAMATGGYVQSVEVAEATLPAVGDARQGLRITLTGETEDGELTELTVDVAAVRVGDDAIALTNGGLGHVASDVTQLAAHLGARRLEEVRKQGRVQV